MAEIVFKQSDGQTVDVQARNGFSIMEVAVNNGVAGIDGECGGGCSCATCHIYLDDRWAGAIAPPTEYETDLLDCIEDRTPASRLSCQIKVVDALDGVVVTIPERQGLA
jgi:ferredoxin, 2Fe-2S